MSKPSSLPRILCILLALSLLLPACTSPTPPPAAVEASPSDTPAPTVTSTPQPTLTPTLAPPTATPTPTQTPLPTATPPGFLSLNNAGISFLHPTTWVKIEGNNSYAAVADQASRIVFLAQSASNPKEQTSDEIIEEWRTVLGQDHPIRLFSESETKIGDGIPARILDLMIMYPQGEQNWRLYYVHQNGRAYTFVVMAMPGIIESNESTISSLMESVQIFRPQPYGLPRDETLLLLGSDPEPNYLDPALSVSSAADYIGLLFSGLVRLSPEAQIVPDLAESWKISSDGLVYTFTLREGLTFASGKPLTAADVKSSWERATSKKLASTTAGTYLGDIVGVEEKLAGTVQEISGVKVIDERTLEVTLDGAKPYFLAKITYPTAFVIRTKDADVNPSSWMFEPDSSGPYQIKEFTRGEALVLERNTKYHAPAPIRYVLFNMNPGGSAISLYEEGSIDILGLNDELVRRVEVESDPLHDEWLRAPSLCTSLVQLDTAKPPMDDLMVRKALAQAIDPEAFLKQLDASTNIVASSVLPPAMPGYTAENASLPFDPEAAKAALAQSSYAGMMPVLTITASGYGNTQRKDVTALVEMWQKYLGVTVRVEYVDPANSTEASRKNHGHMVMYGWCADYPDPENFIDLLYHSDSDFNVAGYRNPALDSILEEARTGADPAARLEKYQQAEAMLLEDVAVIPLFHSMMDTLVSPRVKGYNLSPMSENYIARLSIDPSADRETK